jgi:hypothetical protein
VRYLERIPKYDAILPGHDEVVRHGYAEHDEEHDGRDESRQELI